MVVLELYALDRRALRQIAGFSLAHGAVFYALGDALVRFGSSQSQTAAHLLFAISPFALLHPLGYLVRTDEYSPRVDWLYALCAIVIMLLSQRRQRRSFYYAGMLNLGIALYLIAVHREWFEWPAWAIAVIAAGLFALAAGSWLDRAQRRRG